MAAPRFRRAVDKVARPLLEPLGFTFHPADAPGYGVYAFLRPWKAGWNHGIALQTNRNKRAFAVELGVVRDNFWRSSHFENMGPWREFGLRLDLGEVIHASNPEIDFDFIEYQDQNGLEEALRQSLGQALAFGPAVWERMGSRLLASD